LAIPLHNLLFAAVIVAKPGDDCNVKLILLSRFAQTG